MGGNGTNQPTGNKQIWGFIYNVTPFLALFCKGFLGFCVASIFIAKAICTPQFWIRCRTLSFLTPGLELWSQNNLRMSEQMTTW